MLRPFDVVIGIPDILLQSPGRSGVGPPDPLPKLRHFVTKQALTWCGLFLDVRGIAPRDALIFLEKPFDKADALEIHLLVVRFRIGEREMARSMQYVGEECAIRGDGTGFKCQPHEWITSGLLHTD